MLFSKEKMYLGSFCRVLCSDIIQLPNVSYENHLQADSQDGLTKEEYEAFNNQLPNFRILLLASGILQKSSEGKIKQTSEEIGKVFVQALKLAYEDNNYSKEDVNQKLDTYLAEIEDFVSYLDSVDEEKVNKEGLISCASVYFLKKFDAFMNSDKNFDKHGTFSALINCNRKLIKNYFESAFKKVNILDNELAMNNKEINNIEYSFEFNQFLSKIKTNYDQQPEKLNDNLLIISLTSFCARFFYIVDDRQFYLIKSYLIDVFSSEFNTVDELYKLGISENIFSLIFNSLTDNERNAVSNLFGKGGLFPFQSAPVVCFGKNAYEDNNKPFLIYKFKIEVKNNSVTYNLKMPTLNPSKMFVPLALGYMIKFVYYNFKQNESFGKCKKVILDMLALINDRNFSERNLVTGVLIKDKII